MIVFPATGPESKELLILELEKGVLLGNFEKINKKKENRKYLKFLNL